MKCFFPLTRVLPVGAILLLSFFQTNPGLGNDPLSADSWPKTYALSGSEFAVYMPQILEWTEFRRIRATSAIAVQLENSEEISYGAVEFEADTVADFDRGVVMIGPRTFTNFRFPELNDIETEKAKTLLATVASPESSMDLPLETVTAALERSDTSIADTKVNLDPPPIYYSDAPASLVIFLGPPRLEAVVADNPSLMFVINTNWDVLFEDGNYYLLDGTQWQTAKDPLAGPWSVATSLPESFKTLPDDGNWSTVRANIAVLEGATPPSIVFASDRPAEIVVTDGKPQMMPVPGTTLFYVANTESDLFFETGTKAYYLLVAGRWFRADTLDGEWTSATADLPADFAKIPSDHPKSAILASVKGTPAADEAVIRAAIPQTATVYRSTTLLGVTYNGEPNFQEMSGADSVKVAVNTGYDVFQVAGVYYCCFDGVWFEATSATGPWSVCKKVPGEIYSIPPESPKYNVTHVHVYESTSTSVTVGITSGYDGNYIANGVVMFGLGMWVEDELFDDFDYGFHYPDSFWYGYGCGAVYYPGRGYYRSGARYYGPYGGAGYGAVYDTSTGVYSRSAYAYGPRSAAGARSAYNPWTDTGGTRVAVATPFGSRGRSAMVRDDDWARVGHRSNAFGTVAGVQTSKGGSAVAVNRTYGPDGFAGETGNGDVYVGRDGNIYRKNSGEDWEKRNEGTWNDASDMVATTPPPAEKSLVAPAGTKAQPRRDRPAPSESPVTPPASRQNSASSARASYTNRQTTSSQLSRDSYSRQRASGGRKGASTSSGGKRRFR